MNQKPAHLSEEGSTPSLDDLLRKIHELETLLQEQVEKVLDAPRITVEHMHLYYPKVEDLKFSLETLHIKELSGALNMGNNFGVKVEPKPKEEQKKQDEQQQQQEEQKPESQQKPHSEPEPEPPAEPKRITRYPVERGTPGYTMRLDQPQEEGE
ncbi:MAG TPA: hypothetical protein VFV52_07225 [Bacilli bacterium]|nr:hypothetical protein [Bacilli bacterium]